MTILFTTDEGSDTQATPPEESKSSLAGYGENLEAMVLTSRAAQRIAKVRKSEDEFLRLAVIGGGCHGYSYEFELDKEIDEEDTAFIGQDDEMTKESLSHIKLIVDSKSLELIKGSVVDYVSHVGSSRFVVKNPNIDNHCGCGTSFSIKK